YVLAWLNRRLQTEFIEDFNGLTPNMRAEVRIDINGPNKGPNYYGRDLFLFYIANGKGIQLYPAGGQDDINYSAWNNWTCQKDDDYWRSNK
ncbi:MAG: hypothetical protein MZV70_77060, partial [Desulfobacterales bacterium]|nr:hypothetical protein [Desulfobacterales bacterium]